jgi:hypothetical protein
MITPAPVHALHNFLSKEVPMKYLKELAPFQLVAATLLIMAGCSNTIPQTTAKPQPPPQLGKTPPVIEPLNTVQKQAQAPETSLPVTLKADLTPVQHSIETAVPEKFTDKDHPLGADYDWHFVREGQPEVSIQDGLVKFQAVYRGDIETSAARACRLDPLYPVLEGTGKLVLQEHGNGVLVKMNDVQSTWNLKPESDTKCNMFNLPVQQQLKELFNQETVNQQIVHAVDSSKVFLPINLVWEQLHGPMPVTVAQKNTQLCLYGKVRDFTIGSMKGPVQQTTIVGVARQTPVAILQTNCPKPAIAPVQVHMGNTAIAANEGQPYHVLLSVPVPYAVLNQQLQERLFHQDAKLPTTFNKDFRIEHAYATDANGRTLITVDMSGDLNGTVYYWGTPTLEEDGNYLTIPDLKLANESKIALDEIKTGYWQLVDQELKPRLQHATTLDLGQRIGNMKSALSGQHKSGALNMDILMARQEAARAYSTRDAVVADILLQGTASATEGLPIDQQVSGTPGEPKPPRAARLPEDTREETR